MIMNENQSYSLQDSQCLEKGDESLDFVSKEICEGNESSLDISEVKERDEFKNHKVVDELPLDSLDRTMNSLRKEDQNRLSHHSSDQGKAADLLSFNTYSQDEQQRSQEHEHLVTVEEHARKNENEARDSGTSCNNSSSLVETETNTLADEIVSDHGASELEVCYKEIDLHEVKDICINVGRLEKGSMLLESSEDGKLDHVFTQLLKNDSNCKGREEGKAQEMALSVKKEDFGANFGTAENSGTDSSEKENSLVDSKPPVEELMPNFHECLIKSLDEEDIVKPQPDRIACGKATSQNPDVKLADTGVPGEVAQCGSITHSFNVATSNKDEEQPANSGDARECEDRIADSLSHSSTGNVTGKPVVMTEEVEQHTEQNDSKLDNHSADDQVESHGNTSWSSTNDAETVERGVPRHEPLISNNVPAMARLQHDEGETSFSAASMINYSEPVPFSGSLSHRSDTSTTSTRSFAFPVLQNEWNSSPVRMAKADRRHLRKQKFRRSGLFCCKF